MVSFQGLQILEFDCSHFSLILQVTILLFVCQWLIALMWQPRIDSDNAVKREKVQEIGTRQHIYAPIPIYIVNVPHVYPAIPVSEAIQQAMEEKSDPSLLNIINQFTKTPIKGSGFENLNAMVRVLSTIYIHSRKSLIKEVDGYGT
uniref:Uncharacterized protein n=1 Tax=Ditylenchus dipsaci TaxID=166011 RepID=A0A915CW57_9BILA